MLDLFQETLYRADELAFDVCQSFESISDERGVVASVWRRFDLTIRLS